MRTLSLRVIENQRGVALPLALLGLVSVSLLITTALVTSTTELAMSAAHQDATASLYSTEGALQQYIGAKAGAAPGTDSIYPVTKDPSIAGSLITVTRLFTDVDTLPGDLLRQRQTYSLLGEPADGRGRALVAALSTQREAALLNLNVTAGLTIGGDVTVTGQSSISDGTGALCDSAKAENALQVTAGSTITKEGSATIVGAADTASYTKEQMAQQILGGMTMQDAITLADIKFAPGEFTGRVQSHDSGTPRTRSSKYNWGCPSGASESPDPCNSVTGNTANQAYYPIVAIDAGGGKVVLEGNHGQGVLVVHNGSLEIKGNFVYQGIILVEEDLLVEGTGGGGVKIEGAVVAFGTDSTVKDNTAGNAVITYNRCTTSAAQAAANLQRLSKAPQTFPFSTLGWLEVVR